MASEIRSTNTLLHIDQRETELQIFTVTLSPFS